MQPENIHDWFGLTYAGYLVLPRLALEEAPVDWQHRFIALMQELEDSGIETPDYHVLRDNPAYTLVERDDAEDPESSISSLHKLRSDPWADYRRGTVAAAREED